MRITPSKTTSLMERRPSTVSTGANIREVSWHIFSPEQGSPSLNVIPSSRTRFMRKRPLSGGWRVGQIAGSWGCFLVTAPMFILRQRNECRRQSASFDTPDSEKHHGLVRISIITLSYRSSAWLRLRLASIADKQAGVKRFVVDAGSDDGTLGLLLQSRRVKVFVEKAQGMYDAINRGLYRTSGEMLAHLNCGETLLSLSCINDLPTAPNPVSGSRLARSKPERLTPLRPGTSAAPPGTPARKLC